MIDPNVTLKMEKMESRKMYGTTVDCVNQTLDSQGICFLCLRDINFVNDFVLDKPLSIGNVFKLTSIFRFLKLDIDKVVPTKDANNSKSKRGDLTVSLCQECAIIAKKFNALHQTLELTKIRLTECVERVHELMTEAENNCDRVEEMMERMTDLGVSRGDIFDAPHATIIESLRKEIIMKCAIKVKTAKPRVQVKRLTWEQTKKVQMDRLTIVKVDPAPLPQLESVLHKLNPSLEIPGSCALSSMGVATSVYEGGDDDDDVLDSSTYRRGKTNPLKEWSPKSNAKKTIMIKGGLPHHRKLRCPCCPAVLSQTKKLDDHMIRFHCEHYFLELRDPSVSPDQFIKLANHLLFKDEEDQIKSYAEAGTASCPYCSQIYSYNYVHKLVPLKAHMISAHLQRLAEKVIEIQRDPNFREKLELVVSKSDGVTCSCGLYIPNKRKLLSHQLFNNCPDREKSEDKLKRNAKNSIVQLGVAEVNKKGASTNINGAATATGLPHYRTFPCPCCLAVLSHSRKLDDHMIRFHCEHYFFDLRDPSVSPDQFSKLANHLLFKDQEDQIKSCAEAGTASCPYCSQIYSYNNVHKLVPLKAHMISAHLQQVGEKVIEIQRDPNFREKLNLAVSESDGVTCSCGSYISSRTKLKYHEFHSCPNGQKGRQVKSSARNSDVPLVTAEINKKGDSTIIKRTTTGTGESSGKNQAVKKKRKRIQKKKSCPTCGAILTNLRDHIFRFHREQFFGSCRDPSISPDKFMKLANHLLFKDQDDLDELHVEGNGNISCPYCDQQFARQGNDKGVIPLIKHMINFHRQRLVDKLSELQKDPSLDEKLESAIAEAGGKTCSCGSYVSTRYKLTIHKKYYCSKTRLKSCIRAERFVRKVKMENPQISHRRRQILCHKCGLLVHSIGIRNHLKMCGHQIPPSSCTTTFDSSTSGVKVMGEKEKGSELFPETSTISSETLTLEDGFQDQEMEDVLADPLADVTVSTECPSNIADESSAMSSFVKLEY